MAPFAPSKDAPRALLIWLDAAISVREDLPPEPDTVRRELGRDSLAYEIASFRLAELWQEVGHKPEMRLKRQLWAGLLERVYGTAVDDDSLFFQHTYLTVVAKAMAVHVLGAGMPSPEELLNGQPFRDAAIDGAVESDFFDWVLTATDGAALVSRIAKQVARFRLADIQSDVLKGLYESLIDPEQRRYLGEYYTPDWLASRMCERAIDRPLDQRVLDPACGSGTFLFHGIRRFLGAAEASGLNNQDAVTRCCGQVLGVDIHPVAVLIARVNYLLALGEERLRDRPQISIPVYLGDSLQWNTKGFLAEREVLIEVPDGPILEFPAAIASDPSVFDAVIQTMLSLSESYAEPEALRAWLQRTHPVDPSSEGILAETYNALRNLKKEGLNHIWGYVTRNLSRPVWLSSEGQRADVVIGNPPWLSYRYMNPSMQERFREECRRRGLWAGQVAQQQDLSAYFFAVCAELYLKPTGRIAFVMPYAAMSRRQYAPFRTGVYGVRRRGGVDQVFAVVRFTEGWAFSDQVAPLFPVPSCVLFAENQANVRHADPQDRRRPSTVLAASGSLPRRDATPDEADAQLVWWEEPWPAERVGETSGSAYSERFRDGAVVFPSVLLRVQRVHVGRLGDNPAAPLVESRRTRLEKRPWKDLQSLRGNVEAEFLRPLYLGETLAPFRLLHPLLAVIPWAEQASRLLDSQATQNAGYLNLARWMANAEQLWQQYGRGRRTLLEQMDYYGQLSAQFPVPLVRVVYGASGTLPVAAVLRDGSAVVEHKLYWAAADGGEAYYLVGILNSETARSRVAHLQSRGQWGTRDFDKLMLGLPIPRFDPSQSLHRDLVKAAKRAEAVAAGVELREGIHFSTARRAIRRALSGDGISGRIDELVERLLG
jgi:SAM-dependent methyltransferase